MEPFKRLAALPITYLWLLASLLIWVAAAEEQLNTEFWTNLDPDKADPLRSIVCEGPLPLWNLPKIPGQEHTESRQIVFPGWNPNTETSLLKLCAAPQYGGVSDPRTKINEYQPKRRPALSGYRSVGLFCYGPLDTPEVGAEPDVAVQDTIVNWPTGPHLSFREPRYDFPALTLYCRQRCYCKNPFGLLQNTKPKKVPESQQLVAWDDNTAVANLILIHQVEFRRLWTISDRILVKSELSPDVLANSLITKVKYSSADWELLGEGPKRQPSLPDLIDLNDEPSRPVRLADLDSARERSGPFNLRDVTVKPKLRYRAYTLWSGNKVSCDRFIPIPNDINFPSPFTRADFQNAGDLCPVALAGGNPSANAGAYCDPGDEEFPDTKPPDIWFSDEYTPRLSWTWGGRWRFALAVRNFCRLNCWCTNRRRARIRVAEKFFATNDRTLLAQLPYNTGIKIVKIRGSNFDMGPKGAAKGCDKSGCIVMSNEIPDVDEPWPISILGPAPGPRPPWVANSTLRSNLEQLLPEDQLSVFGIESVSYRESPPTCGQTCSGPASTQCSNSGSSSDGCSCVVPQGFLARALGADPVAPTGYCLQAAKLAAWVATLQLSCPVGWGNCNSGLRGRDFNTSGPYAWDWTCKCNATHDSKSCCESEVHQPTYGLGRAALAI